ncbi:triose-phosphate isomerase [Waddlia chondrophila]|uniref:Uncharacterized protein n=1 Tax=Waddlia chondrophila (strain ATCC VR-1470 / WSU 86-1044) TaxID=716544 RepID=D6YSF7_WADCW|nr:triose-phosphate isomerase [Waddlia chondrophila]ADI39002.1 hypothetical protein wcw_1657 [Waddlia chondrophila WSU 86-1044]
MDKSFICLISCKPYDDLKEVIKKVEGLKNKERNRLQIDPYLALMDLDQISIEERGNFPEITFGSSAQPYNGSSHFEKAVEGQILKEKHAQFVFVGEQAGGSNAEVIRDKVKMSILAGLPVILELREYEDHECLRERLQCYLSDLSDEQRESVTFVCQPQLGFPKRLELSEIRDALSRCRLALEDVCGAALAKQIKILYSIPKFTPELLEKCMIDRIDGVCISPGILSLKRKVPEERLPMEILTVKPKGVVQKNEKEVIEKKETTIDVSRFLTKSVQKEECLIFCHTYDDVDRTIKGLKKLAEAAGRSGQTEWLFALPFSLTSEISSFPQVSCGAWNLSFAKTGAFTQEVHFSMLRERGASFVILGDRMSRRHLDVSDREINVWLLKALERGLSVVVGLTDQGDLYEQIQGVLEGIEPKHLEKVRILLYAGSLGWNLEDEAEKIAERAKNLRNVLSSLYDDVSRTIKILIEISHFSDDPFAYLSHSSIDGISLSASAIKSDLVSKWNKKVFLEKEAEPVEEPFSEEEEVEAPVPILKEEVLMTEEKVEKEPIEEPLEPAELEVNENMERESKEIIESGGGVSTVAEGLELVKLTVDECAERLAEKNFQETYVPKDGDLESPEIKLARLKVEYKRMFDDFRSRSSEGWEVLFKELKEKQHPERESIIKTLHLPLEKILEFTEANQFENGEGKPWFEAIGLSEEQMNVLYEIAKGLFEKKRYTEAAVAFFTLVSLNAKEYGMWFGYGMAKKMEKEQLDIALDAFSIANSLKPNRPEPYIHAAECYLEQGDLSEAKRCLAHGEKLMSGSKEHADLNKWVKYLKKEVEHDGR